MKLNPILGIAMVDAAFDNYSHMLLSATRGEWVLLSAVAKSRILPGRMQLMNMAGVVARPKSATLVPLLTRPAASAALNNGPVSLGSLPTCTRGKVDAQL